MLTSVGVAYIGWKLHSVSTQRDDYKERSEKLGTSNDSLAKNTGTNVLQLEKYRRMVAKYEKYILDHADPDELDAIINGVLQDQDSLGLLVPYIAGVPSKGNN
jgi:hypothetical protein